MVSRVLRSFKKNILERQSEEDSGKFSLDSFSDEKQKQSTDLNVSKHSNKQQKICCCQLGSLLCGFGKVIHVHKYWLEYHWGFNWWLFLLRINLTISFSINQLSTLSMKFRVVTIYRLIDWQIINLQLHLNTPPWAAGNYNRHFSQLSGILKKKRFLIIETKKGRLVDNENNL